MDKVKSTRSQFERNDNSDLDRHYMQYVLNPRYVLYSLIFLRLALVYLVRTFYVPDEYWQSVEVAHKLAFG